MRELVEKENFRQAHLYIITTTPQGANMLESMAKTDNWNSFEIMSRGRGRSTWAKVFAALSLVWCALRLRIVTRNIDPREKIALCHLANPYSRLICEVRRRKALSEPITVVDDGTTTLNEYKLLLKHGNISITNSAPRHKSTFAALESLLFSCAPIHANQVEFFSIWPLSTVGFGGRPSLAKRNDLSMLRARLTCRSRQQVVHFIGQPFVRRGLLSDAEYKAVLSRIKDYFWIRGIKFLYFPHRNEDAKNYEELFEVVRLEEPYELFLLSEPKWPRVVAGFYSACIVTSLYLFRELIEYEVFWGFSQLRPQIVTSEAVSMAFKAESTSAPTLKINTSLRLDCKSLATKDGA